MKTLILTIALMAFTFISCDNAQAPTASQSTTTSNAKATVQEYTIDFGCFEICENCCICLTATVHDVMNDNGFHVNIQYSGTGYDCETGLPNGVTYTGKDNFSFSATNPKVASSFRIRSRDGGCNMKGHFTVTPGGKIAVERFECE